MSQLLSPTELQVRFFRSRLPSQVRGSLLFLTFKKTDTMKNTCKDYDLNCSKHCSPQRLQPVTCVESYHRGEACNATCIIEGTYPTSCRISICQSIYINKSKSYFSMSPRRESNPDRKFRKLLFFPLNYRASAEPLRGLPTGTRSNEAYFSTSQALQ